MQYVKIVSRLVFIEWCAKYKQDSQTNINELQNEIDKFMEDHDKKVEEVRGQALCSAVPLSKVRIIQAMALYFSTCQ